ncbi:MAG: trypsin-like peptidase domain-containing protein, partial [Oscillospiraceae bacterium]|nr:trypsin-like peptidase domain-containing protein [Oscillospiraceae bacterium]
MENNNGYNENGYSSNKMPDYVPSYSTPPEVKYTPPQNSASQKFDPEELPYTPSKSKKKRRWWAPIAVILAMVLCISAGFGIRSMWDFGIDLGERVEQYLNPSAIPQSTPIAENKSTATTTTAEPISPTGRLSASDIYAQSVGSCVGISIEVTYMDWFGGTQTGVVSGSGFVISSDGYIVTNNHVIKEAYDNANLHITVTTYDGTEYGAVIVGTESLYDIALLKIEPTTELKPLPLGSMDNMRIGEDVYVIGNPLGYLTFTFTE